ncbi:MAG: Oligopeptide/dipeptide transporter, ATP-binding protein-like [Roseomonas sp.]|nr:Oligopeptide/dipeptide transporter, ATP-binding protein-like [Roseomonas sp.]
MTYIFITNNLGVVAHVSGRIAMMYLGSLVEMGEAESLLTRPLRPYTAAFLSSEPVALSSHMRTTQRGILKGELPSPVSPPSGCRFRTRCAFARDLRASQEPEWREVEPATGPPAISPIPCPLSRPRMRRWHQRSSHDKTTGLADRVSPVAGDPGHPSPRSPFSVFCNWCQVTPPSSPANTPRPSASPISAGCGGSIYLGGNSISSGLAMPCRAISRPAHHRAGTRPRDHHRRSIGHPGCDEHG